MSVSWNELEAARKHRLIVVGLCVLSLLLQIATLLLSQRQQSAHEARTEQELMLLRTYNENTRERLIALEEQTKR